MHHLMLLQPQAHAQDPAHMPSTEGLVCHFKMNEGLGTVVHDSTSNRVKGDLLGEVAWLGRPAASGGGPPGNAVRLEEETDLGTLNDDDEAQHAQNALYTNHNALDRWAMLKELQQVAPLANWTRPFFFWGSIWAFLPNSGSSLGVVCPASAL